MGKVRKIKLSKSLQTWITKPMKTKVTKKWRDAGYVSESDYLRDLVRVDLKN